MLNEKQKQYLAEVGLKYHNLHNDLTSIKCDKATIFLDNTQIRLSLKKVLTAKAGEIKTITEELNKLVEILNKLEELR